MLHTYPQAVAPSIKRNFDLEKCPHSKNARQILIFLAVQANEGNVEGFAASRQSSGV